MPRVTALRPGPRGQVAVELDGVPWRMVPVDVAARSGLSEGRVLDRPALRDLRRELRRFEALSVAARALHSRDLSRQALGDRLRSRVDPRRLGRRSTRSSGRAWSTTLDPPGRARKASPLEGTETKPSGSTSVAGASTTRSSASPSRPSSPSSSAPASSSAAAARAPRPRDSWQERASTRRPWRAHSVPVLQMTPERR
jgi:hypothetical protein